LGGAKGPSKNGVRENVREKNLQPAQVKNQKLRQWVPIAQGRGSSYGDVEGKEKGFSA